MLSLVFLTYAQHGEHPGRCPEGLRPHTNLQGADAVQVMSEARDIRGIVFKTADLIAMKLGIEKTAMVRVRAGISYALTEAMDDGYCGLPTDEPLPLAEGLLEVPVDLVRTALDLEMADGTVVADNVGETACVFLAGLHRAERMVSSSIRAWNCSGTAAGSSGVGTWGCSRSFLDIDELVWLVLAFACFATLVWSFF
jgi:hypothetical protein